MKTLRWTVVGMWLLAWAVQPGCSGSVRGSEDSGDPDDAGELDAGLGDPGQAEDAYDAGVADQAGDAGQADAGGGDPDAGADGDLPVDGGAGDGDAGPLEVTPYKVTALAVTHDQQYLWIGTASGAARVDMASMDHTLFSTANSDMASNEIVTILADRQGEVWFGYGYANCLTGSTSYCGLSRFTPSSGSWTTYTGDSHGLLNDRVFGIAQAPDDTIWAGTYQGALYNTVSGSWGAYYDWHDCNLPGQHCDPIWSYTIADFAFPGDGSMWLAVDQMPIGISPKPGGVARRNSDFTTDTWKMDHGLPSHRATSIALAGGRVWMASPSGAAYYLPESDTWQETTARVVNDLLEGPDGHAWLATNQGAMRRLPTESWEIIGVPDGLPSDLVSALAVYGDYVCFGTDLGVGCRNPQSGDWLYVH